jgi:hypothetical protein
MLPKLIKDPVLFVVNLFFQANGFRLQNSSVK